MTDHRLTALAALHALIAARPWLDHLPTVEAQPGLRRATPARELTHRRSAGLDRIIRIERAERSVHDVPSAPHSTPVRAPVLDAQAQVHTAVMDSAWIASSALRRRPLLVYGQAWQVLYRDPWTAACAQLRVAIPQLECACPAAPEHHRTGCLDRVAGEIGGLLTAADERARLVAGIGPAWTTVVGQHCDRCRRRTVEAETSSLDERHWIMRCGNGCWIRRAEDVCRDRTDLFALIRSVRRQAQKRSRVAA